MKKAIEIQVKERGWPAHFVLADKCTFTRNTLLQHGQNRVVISSVGCLLSSYKSDAEIEMIGSGRYYEVKAFVAIWEDNVWAADVQKQIDLECNQVITEMTDDSHIKADLMHDEAVAEVMMNLLNNPDYLAEFDSEN